MGKEKAHLRGTFVCIYAINICIFVNTCVCLGSTKNPLPARSPIPPNPADADAALLIAVEEMRYEVAEHLLEAGATPNARPGYNGGGCGGYLILAPGRARLNPPGCFHMHVSTPPPQKIVQTQCWPFGFLTDFSKKERCDVRLFSLACFFFGSMDTN